ncbi:MAG: phytanoyl-CoA dioxygenase family protein, partial [Planctomycetes bacterium]|nr:phytanoyl-CoA dioxygenase family protein [Planctomycetota bacterium]
PWHKDRTVAVKENDLPCGCFCKPTQKAGIPHVEAPVWLLENMLTLRVHLDAMTEENGPLSVIPGSHRVDCESDHAPITLRAGVGDVLAMRPLLSHSSSNSRPGTSMHRRIIHLELAAGAELPDGYEWYSFVPLV